MTDPIYTYQGGRKLLLSHLDTRFVSRAKRQQLIRDDFEPLQRLSAHSWSVNTSFDRLDEDIARARRLAPAYPFYVLADSGREFLVTDRLFMRLRPGADLGAIAARHNLDTLKHYSPRDFLVRVDPRADVVEVVRRLTERENEAIEIVDHDLNVRPRMQKFDAEMLPQQQWHLFSSATQSLVRKRALVNFQGAWQRSGFGSRDVVVAVIDCGCDLRDDNFDGEKFVGWAALIDGVLHTGRRADRKGASVMQPFDLHGTLCTSLIAANANPKNGLGAAPGCRVLPVKWLLEGDEPSPQSLFIDVIEFLRDKVSIVSTSLGLGRQAYWPVQAAGALADAAVNGGPDGKGIAWFWSAGNSNCPLLYHGDARVPVEVVIDGRMRIVKEWATDFTDSFAKLPGVAHVGAISSLGQRCHYSNYGDGLTLVAPSSNSHLYKRLPVSGRYMMAPLGAAGLYPLGGTSAATPLAAGVAALVRSVNPDLTSLETISILNRTADKDLDMRPYPSCGRTIDPEPDWDVSPIAPWSAGKFIDIGHPDGRWSPWFGFGKVNAHRAIEESIRLRKTRAKQRAKFVARSL